MQIDSAADNYLHNDGLSSANEHKERNIMENEQIESTTIRRLMIERIVLINFKSYHGRKEIGPLHKCFSAVVGPNGSGKSNLIESLLFVFGMRAKRMRLNKLSELIHSSADHLEDVKHATVEVHFQDILDNTDEQDFYEVVPGSQLTISRRVNRSSQSSYFVNN